MPDRASGGTPLTAADAATRPTVDGEAPRPSAAGATPRPTVAIVTVNYNGEEYLAECFDSLRLLDYPADRYQVVCVDNASSDGSIAFVRANYPEVIVIEAGANLGFAAGCNLGALKSAADYIAFLNNDAKVDPGWLNALVDAIDGDPETICAAARILDWDGRTIDFVEGHVNFHGFARQVAWRAEVEPGLHDAPKWLLFACGGAMLVRRDVFLDIGGFDEDYFLFFEDVDLGWRMWVLGYKVLYVPDAVTFHRHHGSAGKLTEYRRTFLYERNALTTVIKNYEPANLDRILPAALMLMGHRATELLQRAQKGEDDLDPDRWQTLGAAELEHTISYGDLAPLVALRDVGRRMAAVLAKRDAIQSRRRRTDRDVVALFGQPLRLYSMAHMLVQAYCENQHGLVRAFGIDEIFRHVKARVQIVTNVGLPELGFGASDEGARAQALGRGLAALGHEVIYSLPAALVDRAAVPPRFARTAWSDKTIDQILLRHDPDILVFTHWRPLAFARLIAYRPIVLDHNPAEPDLSAESTLGRKIIHRLDYLANVDLFIAAGEDEVVACRHWAETKLGADVAAERFRVVPGGSVPGVATGVEALSDFCQSPFLVDTKLPIGFRPEVPSTPLWQLPLKAAEAFNRHGGSHLARDVRQYVTWRIHRIRHSLGV